LRHNLHAVLRATTVHDAALLLQQTLFPHGHQYT
jgi:hypothetical protein